MHVQNVSDQNISYTNILEPNVLDPNVSDPICQGVARPCRYLYYVLANKNGAHKFAATLAQHERNIEEARAAGLLP